MRQSGNPVINSKFQSEASKICLSEGMSCNSTCGWESEFDPNKIPYLRSEFTNQHKIYFTNLVSIEMKF